MSSPSAERLTEDRASLFARLALGHVGREYPNKMDHVLTGPEDIRGPRDLHPIYFGSFDWHSCVHGYWTLASVLRRFPGIPEAPAIRKLFDATFTDANVAAECAYLERPASRGFERPYGWAWLLKLQAELLEHDAPWAVIHQPLADAFAERLRSFLPIAAYPVRTGVHSSTSFAFALFSDYFARVGDQAMREALAGRLRAWHGADADAQAWEPSQNDFLSPTLMTAAALRRLLPAAEFAPWFDAYLPAIVERMPPGLFAPAVASDRTDGQIAHLDGLNLSRAWCWRELAAGLPEGDPRRAVMLEAAQTHLTASLPHVSGDYMGEHWLASFALLALLAG